MTQSGKSRITGQAESIRYYSQDVGRELGFLEANWVEDGITYAEAHTLIAISRLGQTRVADLTEILLVNKSSASRLVDRLLGKGLLRRVKRERDGRERFISLTENGRKTLRSINEKANRRVSEAIEMLGAAEREHVIEGMKLYAKALKAARKRKSLLIRPIEKKDNEQMASVVWSVLSELNAAVPGTAIDDPDLNFLAQTYSRKRYGYFVIDKGTEVVGGMGFRPLVGVSSSKHICELTKGFILPNYRGLGFGEELMKRCLASAKKSGYKKAYGETMDRWTSLIGLTKKLGFRVLKEPIGGTGHHFMNRWIVKDL